jgi:hypothetical protein
LWSWLAADITTKSAMSPTGGVPELGSMVMRLDIFSATGLICTRTRHCFYPSVPTDQHSFRHGIIFDGDVIPATLQRANVGHDPMDNILLVPCGLVPWGAKYLIRINRIEWLFAVFAGGHAAAHFLG